jgi:carotenoid 1,2-hydratase
MHDDLSATGLDFSLPVTMRGYRWWYLDALSDDGAHGITIIASVGSVFSPWYALARRGGGGDPLDHCCMHVALYGRPARWAMTDRPRGALRRDADVLQIGPSVMRWDGTKLVVDLAEVTAPIPRRLRGRVTLHPEALSQRAFTLDGAGRHHWQPLAARARVEVAFDQPALRWSGLSYFDTNTGTAPLEQDFVSWDWCRAPLPEATAILYNASRRDGSAQSLALQVDRNGEVLDMPLPAPATLPPGRWRVARPTRSEDGRAELLETLVDAPFYTRSAIRTRLLGQPAVAVHESLALRRFDNLAVQTLMLPFRVPRARR